MLLLLLLHLHQGAAARIPLHEYLHGEDYGYVEAYSGNQENQPQHGSDYNDDYNTEDSYEYKEDLDDDFRSGGGQIEWFWIMLAGRCSLVGNW